MPPCGRGGRRSGPRSTGGAGRRAVLSVTGLSHRFGDIVALDGITFEVPAGHVVGLVGRNGAGKTTIMRSIMGLLRFDRGTLRFGGRPIDADARLEFGYMPEERGLYPQMPLDRQLRYFARLHGLSSDAATTAARRWIERLGLAERTHDRLVSLSHGNQQRLQLAVALVHAPALIVLDEPFSGLDPTAVDALTDVLKVEAAAERCVLFSSHQLDLVERMCDRVVVVDDGRVLAAGDLGAVRRSVPERLRVGTRSGSSWADLPGVTIVEQDAAGVVLDLEPHADPQQVLRAALAAGPVDFFGFVEASLADVYRKLIAQ